MEESPAKNARNEAQEEKRHTVLIVSVVQVIVSLLGFSLGLATFLFTSNLHAGGFWPHIVLGLAAVSYLLGAVVRNGRGWLFTGIVFTVVGLVMSFAAILIDAIQATHIASTTFSDCEYSDVAGSKDCGRSTFTLFVSTTCEMSYSAQSCYCCTLYKSSSCETYGFSLSTRPTEYVGVPSCESLDGSYGSLLWATMSFGILNGILSILGIIFVNFYITSLSSVMPAVIMARPATGHMVTDDGQIIYIRKPTHDTAMPTEPMVANRYGGPMIVSNREQSVAAVTPRADPFTQTRSALPPIVPKPGTLPPLPIGSDNVKLEAGDGPPPYRP